MIIEARCACGNHLSSDINRNVVKCSYINCTNHTTLNSFIETFYWDLFWTTQKWQKPDRMQMKIVLHKWWKTSTGMHDIESIPNLTVDMLIEKLLKILCKKFNYKLPEKHKFSGLKTYATWEGTLRFKEL